MHWSEVHNRQVVIPRLWYDNLRPAIRISVFSLRYLWQLLHRLNLLRYVMSEHAELQRGQRLGDEHGSSRFSVAISLVTSIFMDKMVNLLHYHDHPMGESSSMLVT